MRFTSVDLPTLGRPTTATTGGGANSASRSPTSTPSGGELPVALVGPGAVRRQSARCRCRRHSSASRALSARSLDEVEKMCHGLGFGHVTAVDDDRVVGRPQGRHRARGVQVVATLHVGQHGVVVVGAGRTRRSGRCVDGPAPRPTRSGRSSRRRRAGRRCRCRGPRPRRPPGRRRVRAADPPAGSAPRAPPRPRRPPWSPRRRGSRPRRPLPQGSTGPRRDRSRRPGRRRDGQLGHGRGVVEIDPGAQHGQRHDPVHRTGVEVARTQGTRQTP